MVALVAAPHGSKADLIREQLTLNPSATGQEIADAVVAAAKEKGWTIECHATEIYPHKKKLAEAGSSGSGGVPTAATTRKTPAAPAVKEVTVAECLTATEFCKGYGGAEAVARQLNQMKEIAENFGSVDRLSEVLVQMGRLTGDKKLLKVFGME